MDDIALFTVDDETNNDAMNGKTKQKTKHKSIRTSESGCENITLFRY